MILVWVIGQMVESYNLLLLYSTAHSLALPMRAFHEKASWHRTILLQKGFKIKYLCDKLYFTGGTLSIQQKFRFEISEIPRAQWNSTFRLHRPDPSNREFCYCSLSRIQKSGTADNNFVRELQGDISAWLTEMTRPIKVDHLQSWSRIPVGPNQVY